MNKSKMVAALAIDARAEVARDELACALAKIVTPRVYGRRWIVETRIEWQGTRIDLKAPVIDATDLGVLLAIYAVASRACGDLAPGQSRGNLIPTEGRKRNVLAQESSLAVRTTVGEIARMTGREKRDGRAGAAIRRAIGRLAMITLTTTRGDAWGVTHLIHGTASRGGHVDVALNYRTTRAILGGGQWAAVSMRQWREAGSGVERVVLHRLCALTTGVPVPVRLDTLSAACWVDPPKSAAVKRKRRALVRNAIVSGKAVPAGFRAIIKANGVVNFKKLAQIEPPDPQSGRVFLSTRTRVPEYAADVKKIDPVSDPGDSQGEPEPSASPQKKNQNRASTTGWLGEAKETDETAAQLRRDRKEEEREEPAAQQHLAICAASLRPINDTDRERRLREVRDKLAVVEKWIARLDWVLDPHTRWVGRTDEKRLERLERRRERLLIRQRIDECRPRAKARTTTCRAAS